MILLLNARKQMPQGSELAVVTAEIVDILPRESQTPAMEKWVGDQLANGNSVSDMLAYCKDAFGIVAHKIDAVESKLSRQGVILDKHIEYTDQRFAKVHDEVREMKHESAIDRVHAEYARKEADKARQAAELALAKTQEVAIGVATATAKADGARDLAKNANYGGSHLLVGAAFIAILIFVILAIITRVEVKRDGEDKPDKKQQQSSLSAPQNTPREPIYRCDINETNATAKNCVKR
jgi:hypothetical protein